MLETPGDHVAVSAGYRQPAGAAVRFGDINPTYTSMFKTFSAPRLFSPIGSNVVNLTFRVPGTDKHAVVKGFGAVYTDIDQKENTAFQYFDRRGPFAREVRGPCLQGRALLPRRRVQQAARGARADPVRERQARPGREPELRRRGDG